MGRLNSKEGYQNQRVHVASIFDVINSDMKNVAFSVSNDVRDLQDVVTEPMLVYDTYTDTNGKEQPTYKTVYSQREWNAIVNTANKDGDSFVINADLYLNPMGPGLRVDTKNMTTPTVPFNKKNHIQHTKQARIMESQMEFDFQTNDEKSLPIHE